MVNQHKWTGRVIAAAARMASGAVACTLLLGALVVGCGGAAEDIDNTAEAVTGAQAVKVGRQAEQEVRKHVNDARDRMKAARSRSEYGAQEEKDE